MDRTEIIGNVGSDPQKGKAGETKWARFSVAVGKKFKNRDNEWVDKTKWYNVVTWGKLAETCATYVKKGMLVFVEGEMEFREYEKDGEKKQATELKASNVQFLGTANGDGKSSSGGKDQDPTAGWGESSDNGGW